MFGRDLFATESWATLVGECGESGAYEFTTRSALMWIRPDAFAAGTARAVLKETGGAGFRVLAARSVRLDRCGVRALWAYMGRWATVERLWLLDAVAALGPGLLVLLADETPSPGPAAARLTAVKGSNTPSRRAPGTLREAAQSPNRLLTMVHTADEPADTVRELGVFCPWAQRRDMVAEAVHRLASDGEGQWQSALEAVEDQLPPVPAQAAAARHLPAGPEVLEEGTLEERWAALCAASGNWPLLSARRGPVSWPDQESGSPWR